MTNNSYEELVLLDVDKGVGVLRLNRPNRLNAVDQPTMDRLVERFTEVADRDDIRVIVLTGAGRGFCAGADMSVLNDIGTGEQDVKMPGMDYMIARRVPKPIIAAINGPCIGLGLVFALTCDMRFCGANSKLGTGFARIGLVAEQGLSRLLPRLVGTSKALDLLYSSRFFDGNEAAALGLADRVYSNEELLSSTLEYARSLATHSSPISMAVMKWQVYRGEETCLEQAIDDADPLTRASLAGRDFVTVGAHLKAGVKPAYPALESHGLMGDKPPLEWIAPADPSSIKK